MKFSDDFYQLTPELHWENDAEALRAMALPRTTEAMIKHRLLELQQEIVAAAIDEPGPEGEIRKANLNLLQGKYLALKELLDDSQNAHGTINVPNV